MNFKDFLPAKMSGMHTVLQIRANGLGSHLIRCFPVDPSGQNISLWGVGGNPFPVVPFCLVELRAPNGSDHPGLLATFFSKF